jgi:hypothetical protein
MTDFKVTQLCELLVATVQLTNVRLSLFMCNLMGSNVASLRKPLVAYVTRIRLLSGMSTFMGLPRSCSAICRWQCDLTRSQQMDSPSGFRAERIADHKRVLYKAVDRLNNIVRLQREIWTHKWLITRMGSHMNVQMCLLREELAAVR